MRFLLACLFALFCFTPSIAETQNSKLLAGPLLGYTEHREALIWLQAHCAKEVSLEYFTEGNKDKLSSVMRTTQPTECKDEIFKFVLPDLKPGSKYDYKIFIDGQAHKFDYKLTFKTKSIWDWKDQPASFSFLLGSCAFINDAPYDRPGKPYGQGTEIFKVMAEQQANFMLWLGDTLYLRPADYTSESGIKYRYAVTRQQPDLQKLFAVMNNYAIWDDHDFGPNDSNKSYDLKDVTYDQFKKYWGNKTYGQDGKGIYNKFSFYDADFFLLDGRSFRDDSFLDEKLNQHKTQLGSKQIDWLKDSLSASKAVFKFIAVGGQFLNDNADKESFSNYRRERDELLEWITSNKIKGVIFLTGDRHHAELIKKDREEAYPLYDLTASPLSSGASNILSTPEKDNPLRVPGTLLVDQNFCKISIDGAYGKRQAKLECFNKKGEPQWEHTINQSELE